MITASGTALVERLGDHEEYQAALGLLQHLEAARHRVELKLERLDHLQYLESGDAEGKRGERRHRAAQRLAAIERELAVEPVGTESKIADALLVADGGELPQPLSVADEIARLKRQELALFLAIGEQAQKVEAIKNRISYEYAIACRRDHQKRLRAVYDAAVAFARAINAERAFRADLIGRQYAWRPDQTPMPPLRAAAVLGTENDPSSELSRWRRTLEDAGVL